MKEIVIIIIIIIIGIGERLSIKKKKKNYTYKKKLFIYLDSSVHLIKTVQVISFKNVETRTIENNVNI
jgi:hypothetical protein